MNRFKGVQIAIDEDKVTGIFEVETKRDLREIDSDIVAIHNILNSFNAKMVGVWRRLRKFDEVLEVYFECDVVEVKAKVPEISLKYYEVGAND